MSERESKIFVSRTDEYNAYNALKRIFNFFRIKLTFDTAAIKLNLCSLKSRETGATSDPIVVEQLVKILNENGVKVRLIESNSSSKNADLAFKYLGFKKLEEKYDVRCINISRDDFSLRKINGYYLKTVKIPKAIETCDFFITHPKLKTHSSMKLHITGALKNQFGCLIEKEKAKYHSMIHEIIADMNTAFTPDFIIMDAITVMTGYGPTNGTPQRLNLLIAGLDPVAVDTFGAKILGSNPRSIRYIKLSAKRGLGNMNIRLFGDSIRDLNVNKNYNKRIIINIFNFLDKLRIKGSQV